MSHEWNVNEGVEMLHDIKLSPNGVYMTTSLTNYGTSQKSKTRMMNMTVYQMEI